MTTERCPGSLLSPLPANYQLFEQGRLLCHVCGELVAAEQCYYPLSGATSVYMSSHYRTVPTTKKEPVTQPKPSPLDIAALGDRIYKVVKDAADMVNAFIETEVTPAVKEAQKAADEEARKIRVHYSTGSGFSGPVTEDKPKAKGVRFPFTDEPPIVPQETQPACGATVVMRRVEGLAAETVFCMRSNGPCPYGPHVDITLADGPGYCSATGRRGSLREGESPRAF